jgi:hypothetical protein
MDRLDCTWLQSVNAITPRCEQVAGNQLKSAIHLQADLISVLYWGTEADRAGCTARVSTISISTNLV